MRKWTALLLALLLLAPLGGAYGDASIVTPAGELPIVTEPYTLHVAVPVDAKVENIKETALTRWLEGTTGITLTFTELSPSDTDTQVNMMMNSGSLPDLFLGYGFPYDALCSYVDAGLIIAVDELVDQYASEAGYKRFLNEFPLENPEAYVTVDGGMYSVLAGGAMVTNIYATNGIRLQSRFLEALGLEAPQTLEEFYDYLVAVRDNDPNGNGQADEVPLSAHTTGSRHLNLYRAIGTAFQYTEPANYLKLSDGKVEFVGGNELFRETV